MCDIDPIRKVEDQLAEFVMNLEETLKTEFTVWRRGDKYTLKHEGKNVLKFSSYTLIAEFAGEKYDLSKGWDVCILSNRMDKSLNRREQLEAELKDLESVNFDNEMIKDRIYRLKKMLK